MHFQMYANMCEINWLSIQWILKHWDAYDFVDYDYEYDSNFTNHKYKFLKKTRRCITANVCLLSILHYGMVKTPYVFVFFENAFAIALDAFEG